VERISQDIARRHLPLLVDVGGKPTAWQEAIFSHCTHALLLAPTTEALAEWRPYVRRYGLILLAELESSLTEPALVRAERPIFRARLTGLHRGAVLTGPTFAALVDKLSPYFHYPEAELRRIHLTTAPVELALDLPRLARSRNVPFEGSQAIWQPRHLPDLLADYLPAGEALGLYGRGPNWLYAAIALHTRPAPFYQFDPRLGWVKPPRLIIGTPPVDSPLQVERRSHRLGLLLDVKPVSGYLDYAEAQGLIIPPPPEAGFLILSGKIPHWLLTGLAIAYRSAAGLAVHQLQLGEVVVKAAAGYEVGDLL
jgi:CRISPR-associated protein Csx3